MEARIFTCRHCGATVTVHEPAKVGSVATYYHNRGYCNADCLYYYETERDYRNAREDARNDR